MVCTKFSTYFLFSQAKHVFWCLEVCSISQWTVPFAQFKVFPCQLTVPQIWLGLFCQHSKLVSQRWEGAACVLVVSTGSPCGSQGVIWCATDAKPQIILCHGVSYCCKLIVCIKSLETSGRCHPWSMLS